MVLPNDARGWIMTAISGVACVFGASIICADLLIRRLPHMHNFRIQDSDAFLSASLSLSFGVMLFSALYKMLPSSKHSLEDGGLSPSSASWILMACFVAGAVGIQLLSRVLHHYIPSHVVDCEHSHDEESGKSKNDNDHADQNDSRHDRLRLPNRKSYQRSGAWPSSQSQNYETTSLPARSPIDHPSDRTTSRPIRPTLNGRFTRTLSKLTTRPSDGCGCVNDSNCRGYTDPCGQDCFKKLQSRGSQTAHSIPKMPMESTFTSETLPSRSTESTPLLAANSPSDDCNPSSDRKAASDNEAAVVDDSSAVKSDTSTLTPYDQAKQHRHKNSMSSSEEPQPPSQHHHHVPTNAFMSIGLQTSIAIALHKLPEGFITYATNHANPKLGFSVFLALFIHNITEGFAMALPLYLAIQSRWRAMFWSSLLGGFSQPLGAAIAALWFKLAGNGDFAPGEGIYGGMFAVTSGIMASVALQLFSESLDLTHNRDLCMCFAFIGMGIMGASSALTA